MLSDGSDLNYVKFPKEGIKGPGEKLGNQSHEILRGQEGMATGNSLMGEKQSIFRVAHFSDVGIFLAGTGVSGSHYRNRL